MSGIVNETDLSAFAAEYVIGSLDPDERARANAQLEIDEGFRALVRAMGAQARRAASDGGAGRGRTGGSGTGSAVGSAFGTPAPPPFVLPPFAPPPFAPQPAVTPALTPAAAAPVSAPFSALPSASAEPVAPALEPSFESEFEPVLQASSALRRRRHSFPAAATAECSAHARAGAGRV